MPVCNANSAIFCNNAPEGRGEEKWPLNPCRKDEGREEDAGANGASFLQAAADQTGSMAEGTTGKTLAQAAKNLKGAERQSPLFGSFLSTQIYFTMSQTISH